MGDIQGPLGVVAGGPSATVSIMEVSGKRATMCRVWRSLLEFLVLHGSFVAQNC